MRYLRRPQSQYLVNSTGKSESCMKTFLMLCAAAGLTGCAVYPEPGYQGYGYGNAGPGPYVVQPPVYIYGGSTVYRSESYPRYEQYPYGYRRGYNPAPPVVVVPQPGPGRPFVQGPRPGRGHGDRDRDGIPNRVDRDHHGAPNRMDRRGDRDGDGISDRIDPRPDIPNRR